MDTDDAMKKSNDSDMNVEHIDIFGPKAVDIPLPEDHKEITSTTMPNPRKLGFNIDLSFLQQTEGNAANNGPVHLIADNASVASFGSNTGRPNGPPNNDGRTSASVSFSADNVEAAADTIGGGSTA